MTVVAGLTVNGPGTGIDVQGLVKSLVGAQTAPKQAQIDSQTKTSTAQLTSIGKIQAALDAFRGALDTMTKTVNFSGLSSTLSNDKLATVTLGPGAAAGNFTLGVTQLVGHGVKGLHGSNSWRADGRCQFRGLGDGVYGLPVRQELQRQCATGRNPAAGARFAQLAVRQRGLECEHPD